MSLLQANSDEDLTRVNESYLNTVDAVAMDEKHLETNEQKNEMDIHHDGYVRRVKGDADSWEEELKSIEKWDHQ